ncbi:MAG: tetratricopeptide repeat protein [Lachnospiraceae bacterium]|nr:tetratricopeptide repeat protein [Lachnospiraceae bacterium]
MAHQIIELECPGCAAAITTATKNCPKCFRPIVISTFHSISEWTVPDINKQANTYRKAMADNPDNKDINMSMAFCYLKLKLYDKALQCFEKAIENNFDNSEIYFYAAICLLGGKKAFLSSRPVINRMEEYINAAIMIEPKGIYYYFQAYIKYDYFERKMFNTTPNFVEAYAMAQQMGVSEEDISNLYNILGVDRPVCI